MKYFLTLIIVSSTLFACSPKNYKNKWTTVEAPAIFKAKFETTKGNFEIEAQRKWSPKGVDRLYQLITSEFYTDIALYRVVPKFVVQFGIQNDSTLNTFWNTKKVSDEPVLEKNTEGTISFARGGKESRTSQIFINLDNNSPYLDTLNLAGVQGFPVVAKVTEGMDIVKLFYKKYGGEPAEKQDSISKIGNSYLKKNFPKLDYIHKAYIIE